MNDVLPKPFTKEGLLSMLEKHLGHLKKHSQQTLELNPPQASVVAKRSYKSEDSPATSPATVSNWNSPGNIGVSPASAHAEDPYIHAVHNTAGPGPSPYAMQAQSNMPPPPVQAPMYPGLPPGGLGPRPPPQQQHRRGISDISGGPPDMGSTAVPVLVHRCNNICQGLPGCNIRCTNSHRMACLDRDENFPRNS
jgi:osomolarity two-component system response regulator SKN7